MHAPGAGGAGMSDGSRKHTVRPPPAEPGRRPEGVSLPDGACPDRIRIRSRDRQDPAGRRGPSRPAARPSADRTTDRQRALAVVEGSPRSIGLAATTVLAPHVDELQPPPPPRRLAVLVERPGHRRRPGLSRGRPAPAAGAPVRRATGGRPGRPPRRRCGRGGETLVVEDVQEHVHRRHERVRRGRPGWCRVRRCHPAGRSADGVLLAQALDRARGEVAAVDPRSAHRQPGRGPVAGPRPDVEGGRGRRGSRILLRARKARTLRRPIR